jgi:isopentenyl-diphosphate delta-isomerase
VRVEQLRSRAAATGTAGDFSSWGIPTAAAVASVRKAVGERMTIIASGGIRTGLDVAKCLALGAHLTGMALPLFRAQQQGGRRGAKEALTTMLEGLRHAALLTGSRSLRELRAQRVVTTGRLNDWLSAL